MKFITNKNAQVLRKARNADILRRMEDNQALSSFNSQASWFPPRPIVEKDPTAIKKLYGTEVDRRLDGMKEDLAGEQKPLRLA